MEIMGHTMIHNKKISKITLSKVVRHLDSDVERYACVFGASFHI